jgi:hypothetical protein
MFAEPAPTDVTTPADDTVATLVLELVHVTVPVNGVPVESFSVAVACA